MTTKTATAYERMAPADRRRQILATAVKLSRRKGYRNITRDGVAEEAGVSQGLVNRYFGSIDGLRDAVMKQAIEDHDVKIVAQGIAHRDKVALRAPAGLREQAVASLTG